MTVGFVGAGAGLRRSRIGSGNVRAVRDTKTTRSGHLLRRKFCGQRPTTVPQPTRPIARRPLQLQCEHTPRPPNIKWSTWGTAVYAMAYAAAVLGLVWRGVYVGYVADRGLAWAMRAACWAMAPLLADLGRRAAVPSTAGPGGGVGAAGRGAHRAATAVRQRHAAALHRLWHMAYLRRPNRVLVSVAVSGFADPAVGARQRVCRAGRHRGSTREHPPVRHAQHLRHPAVYAVLLCGHHDVVFGEQVCDTATPPTRTSLVGNEGEGVAVDDHFFR
eukprot:ctg_511.g288